MLHNIYIYKYSLGIQQRKALYIRQVCTTDSSEQKKQKKAYSRKHFQPFLKLTIYSQDNDVHDASHQQPPSADNLAKSKKEIHTIIIQSPCAANAKCQWSPTHRCLLRKKKNCRKKTIHTLHTQCVRVCVIHHIDRLLSHTYTKALTFYFKAQARGGPKNYTISYARNKAQETKHRDFNFDATKTPLKLRELATKHRTRATRPHECFIRSERTEYRNTRPSVSLAGWQCLCTIISNVVIDTTQSLSSTARQPSLNYFGPHTVCISLRDGWGEVRGKLHRHHHHHQQRML